MLVLLVQESPLLFLGQEWGASSPFTYFTDHTAELGRLVTEGRRKEFAYFKAFADPEQRERIPDPQALSTFTSSKLKWSESTEAAHAELLLLYKTLLQIRNAHPACRSSDRTLSDCIALSPDTIALIRRAPAAPVCLLVIVHFANRALHLAISEEVIHSSLMAQRTATPSVSVLYKTEGAELEEAKPAVAHMRGAGAIVLELK